MTEGRFTETNKALFFGTHSITVSGGFKGADGAYYFDDANAVTFSLTIKNLCEKMGAISINDSTKLLSISG